MRKLLLLTLFLLIGVSASAQFSVSGKLRTLRPLTLKISSFDGKEILSVELPSGKPFQSKKVKMGPDLYQLEIGAMKEWMVLTGEPITINGFVNDQDPAASNLTFTGIEDHLSYLKLSEEYLNGNKFDVNLLKNSSINPVAYAAIAYTNRDRLKFRYNVLVDLLAATPKEYFNTQVVRYLIDRENELKKYSKGTPVSDFELVDEKGNTVHLSDFKGKMVLLDFWASWCGPCREEMKSLHRIYDEIKGDDLVFISISLDVDKAKWLKALAADNIPWVALWDKEGFDHSKFREEYGFSSIPFIVLIDKDGKLLERRLRGEQVKKAIETYRK